jgi:uncharacterized protein YqeY
MPIVDLVSDQLKDAMRARDKARTSALRNIRAALLLKMKAGTAGDALSDDEAVAVLRTLAKQRMESIEAFQAGGREDLVAAERAELGVVEEFLPRLADEETTRAWVGEAIEASGAQGLSDLGKVMGRLMGAHKGEIDGKLANRLVREALSD